MKLYFFLITIMFVASINARSWLPPLSDGECGFTRDQAFACIQKYADTNKDGSVTREEVQQVIDKYVPWIARKILKKFGVPHIMKDCDYDNNGILTARDWKLAKDCLPTQENLCTLKWFCDGAAEKEREESIKTD